MDKTFHDGQLKKLWHWVYKFLKRHRLSIRAVTHEGQKNGDQLQQERAEFVRYISSRLQSPTSTVGMVEPHYIVNMDETSVYFEVKCNKTINMIGERTIQARRSGSNSKRVTVLLAVAADGTKLPPFIVFKGVPHGKIESSLDEILPDGMFGCCQESGWMDEMKSQLWISKVWLPYVKDTNESFLLLDSFKCHLLESFTSKLLDCGTEYEHIPGGLTSQVQPCDVGINKPFKTYMRQSYMNWCVEQYRELGKVASIPTPTRRELVEWVQTAWENISESNVRNAWHGSGYNIVVGSNTTASDAEEPLCVDEYRDDNGECFLSYHEALDMMREFTEL